MIETPNVIYFWLSLFVQSALLLALIDSDVFAYNSRSLLKPWSRVLFPLGLVGAKSVFIVTTSGDPVAS